MERGPYGGQVKGVRWKVTVPGLSHSSPIIWGDRLCATTAIASGAKQSVKLGATGEPTAADDDQVHRRVTLCFDRRTGKDLWRRTAREEKPRATRHVKATQANTTL